MTIPQGSEYPDELDSIINMHEVHDSLRLRLAEDYNPGDTQITVEGDLEVFLNFPATGYITLTEQCSDPAERAISFFFTGSTQLTSKTFTFNNLELLPIFDDVAKPKRVTNVTQNVMAQHHNALKDAIIAIEEFVGIKGTLDLEPYGPTMEGRINFLHKLVLQPRAWFTADKTMGLAPLTVVFTDMSFQIGEGCPVDPVTHLWDFGDGDCSMVSYASFASFIPCPSTISVASVVPINQVNVQVLDIDGGTIQKTYSQAGKYDVTLKTTNRFGSDTVVFPEYIHVRNPAPAEATITIVERQEQIATLGDPSDGPPFTTFPMIRTPVETFIDFEIEDGLKPGTESVNAPFGRTYSGEALDANGEPVDPVVEYIWEITDDLSHGNSNTARAVYSVGGIYDLIVRCDTENGAYRITTYEDSIDVVEQLNLWMWNFVPNSSDVKASEFGLISETFKIRPVSLTVDRNDDFLQTESNKVQLIKEFNKNTHFAQRSTLASGNRGIGMLYWASGRDILDSPLSEQIKIMEFNGFNDTYAVPLITPTIDQPWNWVGYTMYPFTTFLFGNTTDPVPPPDTSPTNQFETKHNLSDLSTTQDLLQSENYLNGADELTQNVAIYDSVTGQPEHGHFSVYRTATKSSTGYLVRNDGIGVFFRLKSFYRTEGTLADPIRNIRKLPDMLGGTKLEGEMTDLVSGVFVFSNTPAISAYNDVTGVWETGTVGSDSAAFASLQDRTVSGYSNIENSLLVTSDGDRRAYISYDYSPNTFIKFNEASKAFTSLGARPDGEQWMMTTY